MRFTAYLLILAVQTAWLAAGDHARAQESQRASPGDPIGQFAVRERPKPELDPLGILAGPFILYPALTTTTQYNSNVFSSAGNEADDAVFVFMPELIAKSDFTRHSVELDARLLQYVLADNSSETRTDGKVNVKGRLDISRDFAALAKFNALFLTQPRSSPDAVTSASEPVRYEDIRGGLAFKRRFNRVVLGVGGEINDLNYHDVRANNGTNIDQDFRDGTIYRTNGRVSYDFSPGYAAFVFGEFNERQFRDNRDSDGWRVLAGLEFGVSPLISGEISAGYLQQDFDAAVFSDVSAFIYGFGLQWMPTPLITVNAKGERVLAESSLTTSSSRLDSIFELSADYEVLRNLIVSPGFSYRFQDFQNSSREDHVLEAFLKADYLVNRHLHVGLEYVFADRDSNDSSADFTKHVVGLYVRTQY